MSFTKFSEKIILNKLKNIKDGNLKLVNYDGKVFHFGNLESKLSADIKIINPAFYFNIISGGSSALGEAHMNKDFYTSNLTDLIEISAKNINLIYSFSGSLKIQKIKNFLKRIFASNTKSKSLKHISKHYDLGNDFFSQWLDETLTYSSAVYENQNDNLVTAQKNKYQKLIDLLNIKDNNKVLEIGCGWGGFSEYLAKKYNVSIDCITISKKQLEFTKRRIFQAGLNNKVNVMFLDYRDLKEKYDKVASIEMIEAVGEKYLDKYFNTIKKSLNTNGTAAIQGITIRDDLFDRYRSSEDFIQKYIFPGGMLPSKQVFSDYAQKNQLKIDDEFAFGQDYVQTMRIWKDNFLQNWSEIESQGFDYRFYRLWLYYLDYCIAAFERNTIDVVQYSVVHDHA